MGIALGTEERWRIRHDLEVQVRKIGVPAVAHPAEDLTFPHSVSLLHPDRAGDHVGITGVFLVPDVDNHVVAGKRFGGRRWRIVDELVVRNTVKDIHDRPVSNRIDLLPVPEIIFRERH